MLLLSQLGCWLFSALGVLDAAGCEDLRRAEERLDALTWLKLLFVPTLGLLVIALFMMDEHCAHNRDRQAWNDMDETTADMAMMDVKGRGRRRKISGAMWLLHGEAGRSSRATTGGCQHAACKHEHITLPQHNTSLSSSSTPIAYTLLSSSPSSPLLHLLLLSESNQPTAYTLPPSLPLRDLLVFHSSRHNLHLDSSLVLVFVDGKRVEQQRLGEAVERVGVADGSVVRLEMDWRRMIELMMKEEARDGKEREREMSRVRKERVEKQEKAARLDTDLEALMAEEVDVRKKYVEERQEEDEALAELARTQSQLEAARALRVEAEDERRRREADSGSEREKREKVRLTELIAALNKQTAELTKERTDLCIKLRKVKEENDELTDKRREMSVKADRIEREKEGWKRKVEQSEVDVTARLHATEQQKEQSTVLKSQYENSQRETEEKRQQREETVRATTHKVEQIDKDIARVRERLAEAEKEAVECAKYRQLSKQYESEVKEAGRWKLLVKQGKLREKMLEKETKELVHWRQRAKAFEREVKQLRMWRREVGRRERRLAGGVDGLAAGGWGGGSEYGEMNGLSGSSGMYEYESGLMGMDGAGGLGVYDSGMDEWNGSMLSGGLVGDDVPYDLDPCGSGDEVEEDEAAIPPVDVITHNALTHSSASSLASSSASSTARLSGGTISSTLQPTAAPFVPRLHIAVPAVAAAVSSSSSSAGTSSSSPSSASTTVSSASSASSASSFAAPFYAAFGGVSWNASNSKAVGGR